MKRRGRRAPRRRPAALGTTVQQLETETLDLGASQRRLLAQLCRLLIERNGNGSGKRYPQINGASVWREELPPDPRQEQKTEALPKSVILAHNGDLAPREQETLTLLLAGLGEKQVAYRLKISRHTVHTYVKKIYKHYDVSSRSELLARWLQRATSSRGPVLSADPRHRY